MYNRLICFGDVNLDYHWGFDCFNQITDQLLTIDVDKFVIVTDSSVYKLHGKKLVEPLSKRKPTLVLKSPPGEKFKSNKVLFTYLKKCFEFSTTRRSIVIGFGGGIPGNIAGLLANLLYRGIRFVHIPTTSIAMFDSVLSLKQAVNSDISKNAIGTFYKPLAIYSDLFFLQTLPLSHRRSGLCETIKNSLAISPENINVLKSTLRAALNGDKEPLDYILRTSIDSKEKVMAKDKLEKGTAVILEYGHTIGHAIEIILAKGSKTSISHGEAVGLGMLVAAHISNQLGYLKKADVELHYELLKIAGVSTDILKVIPSEDILNILMFDNKRGYIDVKSNEVAMVILKELGVPLQTNQYPLIPVSKKVIENSLKLIS